LLEKIYPMTKPAARAASRGSVNLDDSSFIERKTGLRQYRRPITQVEVSYLSLLRVGALGPML
jgi:hypothetical protein